MVKVLSDSFGSERAFKESPIKKCLGVRKDNSVGCECIGVGGRELKIDFICIRTVFSYSNISEMFNMNKFN